MRPKIVHHSKDIDAHGNIVPVSGEKPHGFKYALAYIAGGERIVGYDNAEGKGDHRHYLGKEYLYTFSSIQRLFEDFQRDIKRSGKS